MRLTLIQPCIGRRKGQKKYLKTWQMEPLTHAVLASLMPKDVKIKFFDDRNEKIDYNYPSDLVGINIETYTARRTYQIASEFRKMGKKVIIGGFHATLLPDEVAEYADAVLIGESEELIHEVIKDFKNGELKKFYKSHKRPNFGDRLPDRSIFKGKRYLDIGLIETSRGCPFRCEFCAIQSFYKSTQNYRSIPSIIEEIKAIKRKVIFFVDDNLTVNRKRAIELFKAIKPLKIKWVSQVSISAAYDEELLNLMKESGCLMVLIGFESLNPKTLHKMNKDFNTMKGGIHQAVDNIHKHRIKLYPTFIFGYPEDDINTYKETLKFAKDKKFFLAAFNHLLAFPGTPLYLKLKATGELNYDEWWREPKYLYGDVPVDLGGMSPEQIKDNCIKIRNKFFSIPSIIIRSLNKANRTDIFSLKIHYMINLTFRKEVKTRTGFPLGDMNHKIKPYKASHTDKRTYKQFFEEKHDIIQITN